MNEYVCVGSGIVYLVVFFLLCWGLKDEMGWLSGRDEIAAFLWPILFPLAIVVLMIYGVYCVAIWLKETYPKR